jgi:hypothetical protein
VESGARRPGRRWPLVTSAGWNILLVIVAIASGSVVANDGPGTPLFVSLGGTVLLISALAGLLATLAVWVLLMLHGRSGSRRSLLAARIIAGIVVGAGMSSIGALVGLFLLPTGAALLLACVSPSGVNQWYPADEAESRGRPRPASGRLGPAGRRASR